MKNRIFPPALIIILLLTISCQGPDAARDGRKDKKERDEKVELRKYYNEGRLVKEVSYRDSIKHGINRNYYNDGRLKRTIWYENGLKEDTAKWYYPEGMVYRATPYKNDNIHGVQTKYYKTGRIQATIPYRNGLREQGLKEYLPDGRQEETYPTIISKIRDLTDTHAGVVRVFTRLSNESVKVRFYRGALIDGLFDPEKCTDITSSSGMGFLELKPDNAKGKGYVDIIAIYSSRFGNRKIITERIKLPYNNLN